MLAEIFAYFFCCLESLRARPTLSKHLGTHRYTGNPLFMDFRVFSWSFIARAVFVLCFLQARNLIICVNRTGVIHVPYICTLHVHT